MLTPKIARDIFDYNPITGEFFWKIPQHDDVQCGDKVKCLKNSGYPAIKINRKIYPLSRLAWMIVYDEVPSSVTFMDNDPHNCKIDNLLIRGSNNWRKTLTQKSLKSVLSYNPETGIFIWTKGGGGVKAGDIAGSIRDRGYRVIGGYKASRLAWLFVHGYLPKIMDHLNRVRDDNRISNLREVSLQENQQNTGRQINNKSGVTGVHWDKKQKKWIAQITHVKAICIGRYDDIIEAIYSRWIAENLYDFHPTHGRTDSHHRRQAKTHQNQSANVIV